MDPGSRGKWENFLHQCNEGFYRIYIPHYGPVDTGIFREIFTDLMVEMENQSGRGVCDFWVLKFGFFEFKNPGMKNEFSELAVKANCIPSYTEVCTGEDAPPRKQKKKIGRAHV